MPVVGLDNQLLSRLEIKKIINHKGKRSKAAFFYFSDMISKFFRISSLGVLIIVLALTACDNTKEELEEITEYEGPSYQVEDLKLWYSDSAVVRLMVQAPLMLEYENGDQEYPSGIYVEFYEKDSTVTSTLKGDQAYYTKETNIYQTLGNVKLESIKKQQKLSTEELFWNMNKEEVYTDKFVIIETKEDVLHGEGLTAKQDFSTYRILKPTGELGLESPEN